MPPPNGHCPRSEWHRRHPVCICMRIHLAFSAPLPDPSRDDGRVEQGPGGAASPRTEGGKAGAAGGEIQTSAVPEKRNQTESRDYVFYRSRTICSVSIYLHLGMVGSIVQGMFFFSFSSHRSCFEWESPVRSFIALVLWICGCIWFDISTIPAAALLYLLK